MAKKIAFYSVFTVFSLALAFLDSLIPFLHPGFKLGLANAVVLYLILNKKIRGAIIVNISRILLSTLLFSSITMLPYSVAGAIFSFLTMAFLNRFKCFSPIGLSAAGAVAHNIGQIIVALLFVPAKVFYFLPILILSGVISGVLLGIIINELYKRIKIKEG